MEEPDLESSEVSPSHALSPGPRVSCFAPLGRFLLALALLSVACLCFESLCGLPVLFCTQLPGHWDGKMGSRRMRASW